MDVHRDNRTTFLARINFRNDRRIFGIKKADRRAHLYVIGKTGTGKSTLLETLIRQDIQAGEQSEGLVEVEIGDLAASFFVEQFEGQQTEQGRWRWDHT